MPKQTRTIDEVGPGDYVFLKGGTFEKIASILFPDDHPSHPSKTGGESSKDKESTKETAKEAKEAAKEEAKEAKEAAKEAAKDKGSSKSKAAAASEPPEEARINLSSGLTVMESSVISYHKAEDMLPGEIKA